MRLDKLLWFLRLAKTRGLAQERIATGRIRLNGRRVERAAQPIAAGDVLTLPTGESVQVIQIEVLPVRRGPAPEAQACYRVLETNLDRGGQPAIAGEVEASPGEPSP